MTRGDEENVSTTTEEDYDSDESTNAISNACTEVHVEKDQPQANYCPKTPQPLHKRVSNRRSESATGGGPQAVGRLGVVWRLRSSRVRQPKVLKADSDLATGRRQPWREQLDQQIQFGQFHSPVVLVW